MIQRGMIRESKYFIAIDQFFSLLYKFPTGILNLLTNIIHSISGLSL